MIGENELQGDALSVCGEMLGQKVSCMETDRA